MLGMLTMFLGHFMPPTISFSLTNVIRSVIVIRMTPGRLVLGAFVLALLLVPIIMRHTTDTPIAIIFSFILFMPRFMIYTHAHSLIPLSIKYFGFTGRRITQL